jgi:hypothetical protein
MVKTKNKRPRYYPAIPNSTIKNLMGEERWNSMMKGIREKYGISKVIIDFTAEGPKIRLKDPFGKLLGSIAHVERTMKRRKKK